MTTIIISIHITARAVELIILILDVCSHLSYIWLCSLGFKIIRSHWWVLPKLWLELACVVSSCWHVSKITWRCLYIASSNIRFIFISNILLNILMASIIGYTISVFIMRRCISIFILILIPSIWTNVRGLRRIIHLLTLLFYSRWLTWVLGLLNLLCLLYPLILLDFTLLILLWLSFCNINLTNLNSLGLSIYFGLVFIPFKDLVLVYLLNLLILLIIVCH